MAQAPAVNVTASFIGGILNAAITGGETAVKTYVGAQVPILEAPVISSFTNALISEIGSVVYQNLANIVTMVVIDVQTNGEASTALAAAKTLQAAQASGDANAIDSATKAAIAAYAALVNSDGSFTPA